MKKLILALFITKYILKVLYIKRSSFKIVDTADWDIWDKWRLYLPVKGFADSYI